MTGGALDDLDLLIGEAMEEWQIPGLALAVVADGEPACLKVYGQRDVEAGLPVTVDTQFLLCSITKSFTAMGLGMLVDERRLDWTKPVREYIPEFRLQDPIATDRVTVQDLLCHHSGLPRHDWVWMPGDQSREERPVTSLGSGGAQEGRFGLEQRRHVRLWLSEWCPQPIAKLAVQFSRPNLHEHVRAVNRPAHLLLLDHSLANK